MNDLGTGDAISTENRILSIFQRLARSLWLGFALATIAIIFVVSRWKTVDFGSLMSVSPAAQLGAGAAYALGLVILAQAPRSGKDPQAGLFQAGLSANLLKYVPGSVWQGQRLIAIGGLASVARFALAVLAAAGVGLMVSARWWSAGLGIVIAVGVMTVAWRAWGWVEASRLAIVSLTVALSVFVSGALVGLGANLDPWWSAREISGAWGLGVVAVPVPAGLGIRELFLALSGMPDAAAELGVVHRVVTLVVDAAVGTVGVSGVLRR